MTQEDYFLLNAAKDFYQDAKYSHDLAKRMLDEKYTDRSMSLSPKSLAERKKLDDMVTKNIRDMSMYLKVVDDIRNKYFKSDETNEK